MRAVIALGLALGLLAAVPAAMSADRLPIHEDGWYRWQAPAGAQGRNACCYRMERGGIAQAGCNLEGGKREVWTSRECEIASDSMQLFAQVRDGQVRAIRAFGGSCPVDAGSAVHELGEVPTGRSIEWLLQEMDSNPRLLDEALMAVSLHADPEALDALTGVLEDRGRTMKAREQALFWLVQSDSDAAYAYLDRLLSPAGAVAN